MTDFNKLLSTGVLQEEEFSVLKKELFPFFSQRFRRSLVGDSISTYNEKHRKSFSKFLTAREVQETVVIAKVLVNSIIKESIYIELPEIQLLKYNPGNFYSWHQDVLSENDEKKVRIMSMSINLNDDYSGGGLEIKYKNTSYFQENVPGAYCIFPSFCQHRALEVTEGVREAVTFWFMGNKENLNILRDSYDKEC